MLHANGKLLGLRVGRLVGNRGRIKDHHIGKLPGCQIAAILQSQMARRHAAQPPHRIGQSRALFLADIFAQQPCKIAIGAGMGGGFQEHPARREGCRVGTEGHPWQGGLPRDIFFVHQEIDHLDPAAILDHQIDRRLCRTGAAHRGDLGQGLAGQRLQLVILESDQHRLVGAGMIEEIFPADRLALHFGEHALADFRILQPLFPLLIAAFLYPGRHRRIEAGRTGGIGIHIGGDAQTLCARHLDPGDNRVELVPIVLAGLLQMIDFGRAARFFGNFYKLVDRFEDVVALVAHMADIHAAAARRFGRQSDQFRRLRIAGRGIDQRTADTHGAVVHGLADQRPHPVELGGVRIDIGIVELVDPHGGRADKGRHIGRDPAILDKVEILVEGAPADRIADIALFALQRLDHLVGQRGFRPSFAEDLQRDTLPDVAFAGAIGNQRIGCPAEHVDKARCDRQPARVDDARCAAGNFRRNRDNPVIADRDIADIRGRSAAINDQAVVDQDIIGLRLSDGLDTGSRNRGAGGEQQQGRAEQQRPLGPLTGFGLIHRLPTIPAPQRSSPRCRASRIRAAQS